MISAFRASRGGVHQPNGLHLGYTQFQANVAEINIGGHYNPVTGLWTPPEGPVEISSLLWWNANFAPVSATQPNAACSKVYKNRPGFGYIELKAAPGYTSAGYPGTAGCAMPSFLDMCEDGDAYGLWGFGTSAAAIHNLVIDGHHAHSWWTGKHLG